MSLGLWSAGAGPGGSRGHQNSPNGFPRACVRQDGASWWRDDGLQMIMERLNLRRDQQAQGSRRSAARERLV